MTECNTNFRSSQLGSTSGNLTRPQQEALRDEIATQDTIDGKYSTVVLDDLYQKIVSNYGILKSMESLSPVERDNLVDAYHEQKILIEKLMVVLRDIAGRINWTTDETNDRKLLVQSLERWEKLEEEQKPASEVGHQQLSKTTAEIREWISYELERIPLTKATPENTPQATPKAGLWFGPHKEYLYSNQAFWDKHESFRHMVQEWEHERSEKDCSRRFRKIAQKALFSLGFGQSQGLSFEEKKVLPRILQVSEPPSCLNYRHDNSEEQWSGELGYNRLKEALKGGLTPEDLEKDEKFFKTRPEDRRQRLRGGSSWNSINKKNENENENENHSDRENAPESDEEDEPEDTDKWISAKEWVDKLEALVEPNVKGRREDHAKWDTKPTTSKEEQYAILSNFRDALDEKTDPLLFFGPEPNLSSNVRRDLIEKITSQENFSTLRNKITQYSDKWNSADDSPAEIQRELESFNPGIEKWLEDSRDFLGNVVGTLKMTEGRTRFKFLIADGWGALALGVRRLFLQHRLFELKASSRADRINADISFLQLLNGHEEFWNGYDDYHCRHDRVTKTIPKGVNQHRRERRQGLIEQRQNEIKKRKKQQTIGEEPSMRPIASSQHDLSSDGSAPSQSQTASDASPRLGKRRRDSLCYDDEESDEPGQPPHKRARGRAICMDRNGKKFIVFPWKNKGTQTEEAEIREKPQDQCARKFYEFLDAWIQKIEEDLKRLQDQNDASLPRSSNRTKLEQQGIDARTRAFQVMDWQFRHARERPAFESPPQIPDVPDAKIQSGTSRPDDMPGLNHAETGLPLPLHGHYLPPHQRPTPSQWMQHGGLPQQQQQQQQDIPRATDAAEEHADREVEVVSIPSSPSLDRTISQAGSPYRGTGTCPAAAAAETHEPTTDQWEGCSAGDSAEQYQPAVDVEPLKYPKVIKGATTKESWDKVWVPGNGLMCGMRALVQSIRYQMPEYYTTDENLFEDFESICNGPRMLNFQQGADKVFRKSKVEEISDDNIGMEVLGCIVDWWASALASPFRIQLIVVFPPPRGDCTVLLRENHQIPHVKRLYISIDNAELLDTAPISHFSGLKPKMTGYRAFIGKNKTAKAPSDNETSSSSSDLSMANASTEESPAAAAPPPPPSPQQYQSSPTDSLFGDDRFIPDATSFDLHGEDTPMNDSQNYDDQDPGKNPNLKWLRDLKAQVAGRQQHQHQHQQQPVPHGPSPLRQTHVPEFPQGDEDMTNAAAVAVSATAYTNADKAKQLEMDELMAIQDSVEWTDEANEEERARREAEKEKERQEKEEEEATEAKELEEELMRMSDDDEMAEAGGDEEEEAEVEMGEQQQQQQKKKEIMVHEEEAVPIEDLSPDPESEEEEEQGTEDDEEEQEEKEAQNNDPHYFDAVKDPLTGEYRDAWPALRDMLEMALRTQFEAPYRIGKDGRFAGVKREEKGGEEEEKEEEARTWKRYERKGKRYLEV